MNERRRSSTKVMTSLARRLHITRVPSIAQTENQSARNRRAGLRGCSDSKLSELFAPRCRKIGKAGNPDAAGQPSIDCGLDDLGGQKG
jgi:hypothetical protein